MNRGIDAFREWMELRKRVREERQFHLERLRAEFEVLGLSVREANRAARGRFGSRRHLKSALHELGGDWAGLVQLASAHRVHASLWFQPALLVAGILLVLLISPAPLAVVEGVAGRPLTAADRDAVFISEQKWNLTYLGIKKADYEAIQAMDCLTNLVRHQSIHARAQVRKSVALAAIESLVRKQTGNPRLRVIPFFEHQPIVMGPAKAVWGLAGLNALIFVVPLRRSALWLGYGLAVGSLHWLGSVFVWAMAIQVWSRIAWSTDGRALLAFLMTFMVYLGLVALQCRAWWSDLRQRCPFCLERLLLPLIAGSRDCFLLNSETTESVCAHGHGVLVESKWSSRFRPQQSPLLGLIRG